MVVETIKAKGVQTVAREIGLPLNSNGPCYLGDEWSTRCKGGEPSGSLDEVFGPQDHFEALERSEHVSGVISFIFENASGRELPLRLRRVLGMPVDLADAAFARAKWRDASSPPAMTRT